MPVPIVHRGVWRDNRAFGVLYSFMHDPCWSETDVLWTGKEWVLAHDSKTYEARGPFVDTLSELIGYIRRLGSIDQSPSRRYLHLDIKWEEVYNASHSRQNAMFRLAEITATVERSCLWYQFADLELYRLATRHPLLQTSRLGFLVESSLMDINTEILSADFLMLPLDHFSPDKVRRLHGRKSDNQVRLLGYTCPSLKAWHAYNYLYSGCLDGLVVDTLPM